MELYIGGHGQGKLTWVLEQRKLEHQEQEAEQEIRILECTEEILNLTKRELENQEQSGVLIWNHFHEWVRECLNKEENPEEILSGILEKYPDICIISDEVGNGIVPIEKGERKYRERVGRIQCELAARSEKVVRILCGIGQRIK